MNHQVQDILSNPALLKEVPDNILQEWSTQYPFVAAFRLQALLNNRPVSETILRQNAFFFPDREQLYFLLNKPTALSDLKENIAEEIKAEPIRPELVESRPEEHMAIKEAEASPTVFQPSLSVPADFAEAAVADTFPEDFPQQVATPIEKSHSGSFLTRPDEQATETTAKPLSIAERILEEIRQIKEMRAAEWQQTRAPESETGAADAGVRDTHDPLADLLPFPDKTDEAEVELLEDKMEKGRETADADALASIHEPVLEELAAQNASLPSNQNDKIRTVPDLHTAAESSDPLSHIAPFPQEESQEDIQLIEDQAAPETEDAFAHIHEPIVTDLNKEEIRTDTVLTDQPETEQPVVALPAEPEPDIRIVNKAASPPLNPGQLEEVAGEIEASLHLPAAKHLDDKIREEPHTFIEWLQYLDGNLNTKTPVEQDDKEWIEIPVYEVAMQQEIQKEVQKDNAPEIRIVPDQSEKKLFEPNFEEGEVDLFHEIDEEVTKVATASVEFKQDMMTETLARIYLKQGKKDKALEIYNALRLKFPEKSAYFAALIQKIEKEE